MRVSRFSKIRFVIFVAAVAVFFLAGCAASKGPLERKFNITVSGDHVKERTPPAQSRQAQGEKEGRQGAAAHAIGAAPEAGASGEKAEGGRKAGVETGGKTDTPRPQAAKSEDRHGPGRPGDVERAGTPQKDEPKEIVLNFEDAQLIDVVRHITQLLGVSYILETPVEGKVTIHTAGKLSRSELWPVFYQLLEINGLTAVKRGAYYHIVQSQDLARLPVFSGAGRQVEAGRAAGGVIVQIIPLNHIRAAEMAKLLAPFTSSGGKVLTEPETNTLVVVDFRGNIEKILDMVETFDADIFGRINYRFYELEHMDAEEMVEMLETIYSAYFREKKADTFFVPIRRINTVLVISPVQDVFESVRAFIERLDVPRKGIAPQIYVYPVKNGQAGEIADLLNEVFRSQERKEPSAAEKDTGISGNPFAAGAKEQTGITQKPAETGQATGYGEKKNGGKAAEPAAAPQKPAKEIAYSNTLRDHVKIVADETRNSLIIEAIPPDYRLISELLEKIDVLPRQVLIKMTIAEVTLDEKTELGVEWSYVKGEGGTPDTSLLSASAGAGGFKYTIGEIDRWTSALSALASKNKVNILSSPTILASNSRNAKIDITTEVPVASSQYEYTSGENPVVTTNIEYRDTGVMLSVTPHINEVGLVTMDIEQEVSEQAESVRVGNLTYPAFFKRRAETTLTVKSGQAIVIGGLIKETRSAGSSGTPWFVNLPILKYIFGKASDSVSKTELIIFISPRVITSLGDVDAVTSDFRQQMKGIVNSVK